MITYKEAEENRRKHNNERIDKRAIELDQIKILIKPAEPFKCLRFGIIRVCRIPVCPDSLKCGRPKVMR